MGLLRLLLLLAIGWFIWRALLRAAIASAQRPPPAARTGKEEYLPLTQCTICGAHIPQPPNNRAPICERCRSR